MTGGGATLGAAPRPGPVVTDRAWFDRPAIEVARDLLGAWLIHDSPAGRVAGIMVEVEAYQGPEDLAAHSARGRTGRNAVMFGEPGHLYVYLIYGLHHCLNVVCGPGDKPEAVLLRSVAIHLGEELARARRGPSVPRTRLAAGPGNVGVAFGVDRSLNGADLVAGPVWIAGGSPGGEIVAGPRIGVAYAREWADRPLRFHLANEPHLSRR